MHHDEVFVSSFEHSLRLRSRRTDLIRIWGFVIRIYPGGHPMAFTAKALAASNAAGNFAGSFPPACAICGRPPPPPPAILAASRTQSPAFSPLAIKSSDTAEINVTLPSLVEA